MRGPASEESPVAVDMESKASYDLASIHRVLRHKDMGGEALLGGFLAASAKDVLTADNLEQIINTNADRACVYLGQIHGLNHKHAVHYEIKDLAGPMVSPVNGSLSHQRALPVSQHEALSKFCKKAAATDSMQLASYRSKCLAHQSIEVMPLHFTALECDNVAKPAPQGPYREAPSQPADPRGGRAIR